MRIDETHRPWARFSVLAFAVATAIYVPYALISRRGVRPESPIGLAYGTVGLAMMLFAALLSFRKKFPVLRVGRAKVWMRAHLWLGLLSYPIILFHAGFRLGGELTTVLMVLFTVVLLSGIFGAVLQHYLPTRMTTRVPMETIFDQIDTVLGELCKEADEIMSQLAPALEAMSMREVVGDRTLPLIAVAHQSALKDLQSIRTLYSDKIQPYLLNVGHDLANEEVAAIVFDQVRKMSPPAVFEHIDDLQNICVEKRQLDRQVRLQRWLQTWLFVHLPISWTLLLLAAIHAVVALRY